MKLTLSWFAFAFAFVYSVAAHAADKPNILVIFGDDIGIANVSAYSDGLMGYETPNIDRIGKEGMRLPPILRRAKLHRRPLGVSHRPAHHPHRAQQGRLPWRADGHEPEGSIDRRPAEESRLRHGPVRQEPRRRPQRIAAHRQRLRRILRQPLPPQRRGRARAARLSEGPGIQSKLGPRGVLDCKATDDDDPTVDPRFGKVGKQTIKDTGPLTKKRMETIDDETSARAIDFMKREHDAGKPFFCWFNATRMHLRTHVRAEHRGRYKHGDSEYIDGMIEHDDTIGTLLKALDDMGIANEHDRRLHERQRPAHEHLAGWRDDPVPLGKEHQLGRRVPRSLPGPLARPHQSRARSPTRS